MDNNYSLNGKHVLIIGAGVVGSATGIGLSMKGYDVTFVDTSKSVIASLKEKNLKAFYPTEVSRNSYDFIFICLPTPYDAKRGIQDMSIVKSSADLLSRLLKNSTKPTIVLRSTVIPGTSRDMINTLEYLTDMKEGNDFYLCANPEFLRARSALEDFMNPWAVVIGSNNDSSTQNLSLLYQDFISKDRIYKVGLEEAELIKYAHNVFNATKISFANQIWLISKQLGIDGNKIMNIMAETAEGSWNKKYGTRGGMPYGGACLPKDTKGFISWLDSLGIKAPLIESVDKINNILEELVTMRGRVRD